MTTDTLTPLAETIAAQLGETEPAPRHFIEQALKVCGPELAQAILQETLETEARGGLTLPDGSRRRTPGGVFFYLLRQRVGPQEWHRVRLTAAEGQAEETPPLQWAKRAEAVQEAQTLRGEATAWLVVVGRPIEVKQREGFVIVTMEDGDKLPPLPKGLPPLESLPTTYKVCIVNKQWRKVEAALKNPQDALVAEGYAYPNDQAQVIVVLAKSASNLLWKMVRRQAQKARTTR